MVKSLSSGIIHSHNAPAELHVWEKYIKVTLSESQKKFFIEFLFCLVLPNTLVPMLSSLYSFTVENHIVFRFNPLSPNIKIQILHTDLYTFPLRISWENLIKDQGIFSLVIILLILIASSLNNIWILLGENWSWSLLVLKGLTLLLVTSAF